MKEELIDEETINLQKFDVAPIENPLVFVQNRCPMKLKDNGFIKSKYGFGNWKNDKKFEMSKRSSLFGFSIFFIILCFIYSFSFYATFFTYIASHETKLLIYSIIIYVVCTLIQVTIIPKPITIKSRVEFDDHLNKALNAAVSIKLINKKKKKQATYPAKYTVDISGTLNIPSKYNFARIKAVQLYTKDDLKKLIKDFGNVYESSKIENKMIYNNEDFDIDENTPYALNSNEKSYSINFITTISCVLLLQWVNAIYYECFASKKCINIYLAKILTSSYSQSNTKITIHNKKYEVSPNATFAMESNEEFDKDLEEYLRKKKEEEERQAKLKAERLERAKKRKQNTTLLSKFKYGDHYTIVVKKVYDDIELKFEASSGKKSYWYKRTFWRAYDQNIQERVEKGSKMITYYPKGLDIRIEVILGVYDYHITIGDGEDYSETIPYNY